MPRVYNHNRQMDGIPTDAIYIGRPSKWGNPFKVGRDGTRDEVIRMYEDYLAKKIADGSLDVSELRGKDLVCCCKPLACHGDVLLRLANPDTTRIK